jgi:hypothetical protein
MVWFSAFAEMIDAAPLFFSLPAIRHPERSEGSSKYQI